MGEKEIYFASRGVKRVKRSDFLDKRVTSVLQEPKVDDSRETANELAVRVVGAGNADISLVNFD